MPALKSETLKYIKMTQSKTTEETGVSEGEDTSSSSSHINNTNSMDSNNIFLGRWILVDCDISAPFISMTSGEMITKRQINEETGDDEYISDTKWTIRYSCLPCIKFKDNNSSIVKITGKDTYTEMIDGVRYYGRIEGNKLTSVGKTGTHEMEYRDDRCYVKIIVARTSLYVKQEWKSVETFT